MNSPRKSSSHVPLWMTVGFALGIGVGAMLFRDEARPAQAPVGKQAEAIEPDRGEVSRDAGSLAALEQAFQRWGGYAVWENDTTQFAAWDPRKRKHSDFVEVRRTDGRFYFRTLRSLSRPLIDHGPKSAIPFLFTETKEMRDQFYRDHPNYNRDHEEVIELPPRPPRAYDVTPELRAVTPPYPQTPGAGKW
jgi:hypothetical protein